MFVSAAMFVIMYIIYQNKKTEHFDNACGGILNNKKKEKKEEDKDKDKEEKEKEKKDREEKEKEKEKKDAIIKKEGYMDKEMDFYLLDKDEYKFDVDKSHYREKEYIESRKSFQTITSSNPFSNPIISIDRNNSKMAPPATMKEVHDEIIRQSKKSIQNENKSNPAILQTIFANKVDEFDFDQSQRQFYSVPHDEGIAEFLYGNTAQNQNNKKRGSCLY
jgi:hypothetical protein